MGMSQDGKACSICMEDFEVGSVVRTLPCFHTFHKDCVDKWLKRQLTCPNCKHPVDATAQASEVRAGPTSRRAARPTSRTRAQTSQRQRSRAPTHSHNRVATGRGAAENR